MPAVDDRASALRLLRDLADLSQMELAELAGIHNTTISAYESGNSSPKEKTVTRVLKALHLTLGDLEEVEDLCHSLRRKMREARPGSVRRREVTLLGQDWNRFSRRFLRVLD